MDEQLSVNSQGVAPKLETYTTNKVMEAFAHQIRKHTRHRFLRRVYVFKNARIYE